jgi:hypothetical protein
MAKILLCRTAHIVEIDEKYREITEDELRHIESLIETTLCIEGVSFEWLSSTPELLDTTKDNMGKCNNCGVWTTDCNKENPITELSYGTHVDGKLLCDLCLPKKHPLKFP